MTTLDWIILVVAIAAAIHGALRGFLAASLALVGFLGGAWAGSRIGPLILPGGDASPWSPLFALGGALLVGGLLAALLESIGVRAGRGLRRTPLAAADAVLGALLGAVVALTFAWLAGAVALQTPGVRTLRAEVQQSQILQALNEALPPSGGILRALARFDPLPSIAGPSTTTLSAPDRAILRRPGVAQAADGVVRILGSACGLGVEGSGWLAAPNVVVTNAHVVAGTDGDVVVRPRSGNVTLPARALAFDPVDDVAVLAVPGLSGPVLRLVDTPAAGTAGALLGYPHNGPFDVEPARIGQARRVLSQDAYGQGPVERPMTPVRGLLRPGNSGGPIVDARGRVLTTVFASSRESDVRGGYGVPNSVVASVLEQAVAGRGASVSTGPCTR
jgi:S1-C subfamily serine protease